MRVVTSILEISGDKGPYAYLLVSGCLIGTYELRRSALDVPGEPVMESVKRPPEPAERTVMVEKYLIIIGHFMSGRSAAW